MVVSVLGTKHTYTILSARIFYIMRDGKNCYQTHVHYSYTLATIYIQYNKQALYSTVP